MKKVLLIDTSILCLHLDIPGKNTAKHWDKTSVADKIKAETEKNTEFVLPLATIIETGNHIAQIRSGHKDARYQRASELIELLKKSARQESPWVASLGQHELWKMDELAKTLNDWPTLAAAEQSIGDRTIILLAEFYQKRGYLVEIFTDDEQLKSYTPTSRKKITRRKKR